PHPIPEAAQKNRWRAVLGIGSWPEASLKLSAVDVSEGATRLFDRSQDAAIEAAVAASTAIPGLHAPITVDDHRYMDGGVAGAHIDVAQGYGTVIAIVTGGGAAARQQVDSLRSAGARVALISPDAQSAATVGADRFVMSQVKPSAESGLRQAAAVADEVRNVWSGTTS
ncbi:MAG TPA: patatin-like phospholipase family protein, partial [Chloroflexota bacterium]|nr:patatin-like phospholipase family protein [Chloroflexota bacterium]